MSTLHITEFVNQSQDGRDYPAPIAQLPPLTQQAVTISGTSAQSATLNAATKMVRVIADAACALEFGTDPTATASSMRLESGSAEYFGIAGTMKIAAITV